MKVFQKKAKEEKMWTPSEKNLLISFSFSKISSGMVCNLLYYLYKEYGFTHITYIAKNCRFYLYYQSNRVPKQMRQFFTDRNPAQIEELCRDLKNTIHIEKSTAVRFPNGFLDYDVSNWKEVEPNEP